MTIRSPEGDCIAVSAAFFVAQLMLPPCFDPHLLYSLLRDSLVFGAQLLSERPATPKGCHYGDCICPSVDVPGIVSAAAAHFGCPVAEPRKAELSVIVTGALCCCLAVFLLGFAVGRWSVRESSHLQPGVIHGGGGVGRLGTRVIVAETGNERVGELRRGALA